MLSIQNKYNRQIRNNQSRIKSELAKLQKKFNIKVKTTYEVQVHTVNQSYNKLNQRFDIENEVKYRNLLKNIEEENANNLLGISEDLDNRWKGTLYSLNTKNPDATRHFCKSTREIFIQIIDLKVKEDDVLKIFLDCEKTNNGTVSRRSKYLLYKKDVNDFEIENSR